jgi:hypothetical protein
VRRFVELLLAADHRSGSSRPPHRLSMRKPLRMMWGRMWLSDDVREKRDVVLPGGRGVGSVGYNVAERLGSCHQMGPDGRRAGRRMQWRLTWCEVAGRLGWESRPGRVMEGMRSSKGCMPGWGRADGCGRYAQQVQGLEANKKGMEGYGRRAHRIWDNQLECDGEFGTGGEGASGGGGEFEKAGRIGIAVGQRGARS